MHVPVKQPFPAFHFHRSMSWSTTPEGWEKYNTADPTSSSGSL